MWVSVLSKASLSLSNLWTKLVPAYSCKSILAHSFATKQYFPYCYIYQLCNLQESLNFKGKMLQIVCYMQVTRRGKWFYFTTPPRLTQLNTQITKYTGSLEKLTVPELIINIVGLQGGIFKIATACGKFPCAFPAGFQEIAFSVWLRCFCNCLHKLNMKYQGQIFSRKPRKTICHSVVWENTRTIPVLASFLFFLLLHVLLYYIAQNRKLCLLKRMCNLLDAEIPNWER